MSILDRLLRRTSPTRSGDQLARAIDDLIAQLRAEGKEDIADELARGWTRPHGRTDGWTLFLEAVDSERQGRP